MKNDKDNSEEEVVGGFAFFMSLIALPPLSLIVVYLAIRSWQVEALPAALRFLSGSAVGAFLAATFIKGRLSVFLHELKHSILSNLVGNEAAGMEVNAKDGHFEYKYSAKTARYNAMISLAPYCLPLCTACAFAVGLSLFFSDHQSAALCVGIGYGADIVLNSRDISPIQTDLTLIRGGYTVGLIYIISWNLIVSASLAIWLFNNINGLNTGLLSLLDFAQRMFVSKP